MILMNNPFGKDTMDFIEENAASRVGNRIRRIREDRGLSQGELGELVGLSADRIQKYENGQRKPKTDLLKKIAKALGVSSLALADPIITSQIPAMYAMFELAETYNMRIEKAPEGHGVGICLSVNFREGLYQYLEEWLKIYQKMEARIEVAETNEEKETIIKEYHDWQWNFPEAIVNRTSRDFLKLKLKDKIAELQEAYNKLEEEE